MAKKALFLDRDGVINKEVNYLHKIEDFEFIEGIFELCRFYQEKEYLIIVVTNQSGIARGYYTEKEFDRLTSWMIEEFSKHQIKLNKVYYCPHHPDINGTCECRKPDIGMFIEAKNDFDIDLENSIMVGDNERDIEAAIKAGVEKTYFFDEHKNITDSKATKIVHRLDAIYR
ncbi:D-glycero-beta-D-manno-heptose 1,7-bisphosphate 7-phosphatase [bacterium]|nr:D-glycero-beta-D-manno-heptose 1,7-bisphosphate 7-phosphatase [bacterium]MBU1882814.1 D-glycero-beta-D-manno-heptose 1,7-bisphosphate 7-phosphatase [bacterium]